MFRFAVMGAGGIARRFCKTVNAMPDCTLCAVSSKSAQRAQELAKEAGVPHFYADYEEMLQKEKPDAVYIAVTPHDHFRLSMLCLQYQTPVLCEKAMFRNSEEAKTVFDLSEKSGVFTMEALWSRFLPSIQTAKTWLHEGRIGKPIFSRFSIGFAAPKDPTNRYYCEALGGGAAYDVTVYAWQLHTFLFPEEPVEESVQVLWSDTGVDIHEHVALHYPSLLASLEGSLLYDCDEVWTIFGEKGRLVLPHPHYFNQLYLQDPAGKEVERFCPESEEDGFTYQIRETMRCVKQGLFESPMVPHHDTLRCAQLFDRILQTKKEA